MLTIQTLSARYQDQHVGLLADNTRESCHRGMKYLIEAVRNVRIDRLGPEHAEQLKSYLARTGRAKGTINLYLRAVKRILQWAVEMKLLEENPFEATRQLRVTPRPVKLYTAEQVYRMIAGTPDRRWQARILCAWTTGLRRGAILNLTIDNIRDGYIWVEPKYATATTWPWEPKDRELRKVPLVPELTEMLEYLEGHYPFLTQRQYDRMLQLQAAGMLAQKRCKKPDQNFSRNFRQIQVRVFGQPIGDFHSLRRTYTSCMCDVLPEHIVRRLTGHNSTAALTPYLGARESHFQEARQIASDAIKEGRRASEGSAEEAA